MVKDLSEVPDPVFAEKMMGDGYALDLANGEIYAPMDGKLVSVFPTGHAFGIKNSDIEVLLHIGIDTVALEGKGFDVKVKQDQKVKKGDLLAIVDLEYIKSQNKETISPMIFTSGEEIEVLKVGQEVDKDSTDIFKFK